MPRLIFLFLLFWFSASFSYAADDIVTTTKRAGDFSLFLKAVQVAGLTQTLDHGGSYTVFAPTDAAFGKLPPGILDELLKLENKRKLTNIVEAHILRAKLMAADIKTTVATTFGKSAINVVKQGSTITYGGASVIKPDIIANNGVIHVIDKVVFPNQEEFIPPAKAQGKKARKEGSKRVSSTQSSVIRLRRTIFV